MNSYPKFERIYDHWHLQGYRVSDLVVAVNIAKDSPNTRKRVWRVSEPEQGYCITLWKSTKKAAIRLAELMQEECSWKGVDKLRGTLKLVRYEDVAYRAIAKLERELQKVRHQHHGTATKKENV
jgi:hypothetical protein